MILNKQLLNEILVGASLLGTGGGGRYDKAQQLMRKIGKLITLVPLPDVNKDKVIVTVFGVGGLKKAGNLKRVNTYNLRKLSKLLQAEIKYLIPVEIGPLSVMNILYMSQLLGQSVVDADLVGYRASPEVYLETLTLANIGRAPLIASDGTGRELILQREMEPGLLEKKLRQFSAASASKVYVAGYPLKKETIQTICGAKSISYCMKVGRRILKYTGKNLIEKFTALGIIYISEGYIKKQKEKNGKGFTYGTLTVKSGKDVFEVIYKNEFLILLKNKKIYLTCPDSILILDVNNKKGINNSENNLNKRVMIFARKAIPIWRTVSGKKLFSPKKLGFNYSQKLL